MATRPAPDQRLGGRYALREQVGRGGFGVVWRAHDTLLRRDVAVKAIEFPPILDDAEQAAIRTKVLREAQAAARLNHPGLVTVFDVIEEDGRPLIVMELVKAPTLADLVVGQGPLAEERAASIGLDVLDALGAAHAQGIVHRDVKPANVMVSDSGHVQLGDFGIAAVIDDPKLTNSGNLAGSPSYMAPEQAENRSPSAATDLWGLGATLYFAVEGQPPFAGAGAIATLTSVVNTPHRPLERATALAPLIDDLLAKDPDARPTAADTRRRLTEVLSGAAATAPPDPDLTAPFDPRGEWPEAPAAPARPTETATPARPARLPTRSGAYPRVLAGLVLGVLVLATVLVAALVAGNDDGGPPTATPAPSSQSGTADAPSTDSAAAVPAGWVAYRDPSTGFSISHPPDWTVRTDGTLTDFRDPGSGAYLRVDHVEPPGPSPEGDWYEFEPRFAAQNADYKRIQITPTTYQGHRAALWEFTYSGGGAELRAVDLGFVTGRYGFALNFQTRAADWDRLQPVFEAFKASFRAPSS